VHDPTTTDLISCDLIGDLPAVAAQRWGHRTALICGDRAWTYAELDQEVDVLARALRAVGVEARQRVALWLTNGPELQFLLFAIIKIGAVVVPLNTRYRAMELAHALQHSGSTMLIGRCRAGPVDCETILADALGQVSTGPDGYLTYAGAQELRQVVMIGDARMPVQRSWAAFRAAGLAPGSDGALPAVNASDPAMMMYTSGTTGRPKGVLLSHAGLRLCRDRTRIMGLTHDDVQLVYLPLFHIYAIGYSMIMSFLSGASQVLMDVFNGEQALRLIQEHRVTVIHGFEAHFADLLAAQARAHLDIGSLRIASFATGADSARPLAQRVQDELCPTCSSYGLTEMWGGITISPPDSTLSQRCEGSGLAQPGIDIRIVDPHGGKILPANAVGEIQVRGYSCLIGYHADPNATAAAMDADGWFSTGDAGLLREDGHLRYIARYKDMLKVGGENVAPAEIEELLCSMPGVMAAVVVGQPDDRLQEVPVAFVVGAIQGCPTEQQIIGAFQGRIARFKIPARVVFVDELPMTSTGKVQKEVLRRRLHDESPANPVQER
jgi:fatty-acyl-CoA synthase